MLIASFRSVLSRLLLLTAGPPGASHLVQTQHHFKEPLKYLMVWAWILHMALADDKDLIFVQRTEMMMVVVVVVRLVMAFGVWPNR